MNAADPRQRLLELMIRQTAAATPAIAAAAAAVRIEPASFAQRRLWFIEQVQQVQAPYTLHAVQHLRFAVDAAGLETAIREVASRHEVLRTTFDLVDDDVVQRIAPHPSLALGVHDLRGLPAAEREAAAKHEMAAALRQRFDLRRGPLLRAQLYRLGDAEYLLLVAVHHIVFDWQSFQIFFRELETIYGALQAGQPHGLPPVVEQYAVFAREQREQLEAAHIEAEVAFWRGELASLPMLDLPLDRPRPRLPSFRGDQLALRLAPALVQRLQQRAVAGRTTLFTVLLAGLAAALGRVCRQQDFAIGLPATGRDSAARQQALGFFVDTLVVRLRWADDPVADDLLAIARDALRRVLNHRQFPFELLVQHVQSERDLGVNPLFQVGFQLMQEATTRADAHATDPARASAMFDVCIDLWPEDGGLAGRVQFNADIFDPPTVDMLCQTFTAALAWLAEPQRRWSELAFDTLAPALPPSLLAGATQPLRERSCLELLTDVAVRCPDAMAIEGGPVRLTYRELLRRVEDLAGVLSLHGLRAGSIAVLELPRSLELVLVQLAVWRAGAAFACMDPAWPAERRVSVRGRVGPSMVIDVALAAELLGTPPALAPPSGPDPHDVAYVIFTSGSTGEPKSVVVEHLGLVNVAQAQRQIFGLAPGRRVAQLASPTFDASIFEITLALCSGATLAVAPPGIIAGDGLHDFLASAGVDAVVIPPSVLATADPARCPGLRLIAVAGESCPADLAERFGTGRTFWNLYGPTEVTIWATAGRSTVGAKVAIGTPIPNLYTAVVDEHGRVVPVGAVGELCLSAVGLARGYLNDPVATERAFTAAPPALAALSGSPRAYRTGDLVRQLRSGDLVFLGRADRQVKVRGVRIEPEEIERVLRSHPNVSDVLVDAADVRGETVLVAYLQTATEWTGPLVDACRELLRSRLPAYMCPSHFVPVAAFPRSASGKIDRAALPPPASSAAPAAPATPLKTETERGLAAMMEALLHRTRVGADDDFFRIGGHSLAAAQLTARVRVAFGVEISIADVFAHSTVAALAARIDDRRGQPSWDDDDVPLVHLPRAQAVP